MSGDSGISRRTFVSGIGAGGIAIATEGSLGSAAEGQVRSSSVVVGCAPSAAPRRGAAAVGGVLAGARAAGVSTLVVPVFGIEERGEALELLLRWRRMVADRAADAVIVERAADLEPARRGGRVALVGHAHGLQWVERDLRVLDDARAAGIRLVKLSPGWRNLAADGAFERSDLGLTRFGRELVPAIGQSGMILDLAGAGRKSAMEAIERAGRPVIVSHAGAAAVHAHPGNLDDARIKAVAASGGVIGVTAFPGQLGDGPVDFERWRRHLDHLLAVAGPEHVGLGLDFDDVKPRRFPSDPWPDPPFRYPGGLASLDDLAGLGQRLRRAGLPATTVAAVMGGNFDRLFRSAFGTVRSTQTRRST